MASSPYSLIVDDMSQVDNVIRGRLRSDVVLVNQVAEYIVAAGGKRLRPALVLLTSSALGYAGTNRFDLAAIVEFIHTATLLHDDVVDESKLRRGRDTANAIFGNAASVLVGDFLYSRAFQMMVNIGSMRIMEVLSDATNVISEGEVLQLLNCNNPDITLEEYLQVIQYKTAKLFEASARLGGILAGADEATEAGLARYGMHLGTAFQLIDDVLDYSGIESETGKHVGDDLSEGKPTLPLIHVMKTGSPSEIALVKEAICTGGTQQLNEVLAAIARCGALEETKRIAIREAEIAKQSIYLLSPSQYKDCLLELADFAVARCH